MNDPMIVVSGDGHVAAPPEYFIDYLDAEFKPLIIDLIRENVEYLQNFTVATRPSPEVLAVFDRRNLARSGGEFGSFDIDVRLRQMDAEGITAEILHPATQCATLPFFFVVNKPRPPEVRAAGARAYHRWLADFMGLPRHGRHRCRAAVVRGARLSRCVPPRCHGGSVVAAAVRSVLRALLGGL
jgi:hypothetical protein